VRYYLSSWPLDVQRFAHAVRHHWGIESHLHWVLDVAFRRRQPRTQWPCSAEFGNYPPICAESAAPGDHLQAWNENQTLTCWVG
jgi:hypothetical protein